MNAPSLSKFLYKDIQSLISDLTLCHRCHKIKDKESTKNICTSCNYKIYNDVVPFTIEKPGTYFIEENIIWKGPGPAIICSCDGFTLVGKNSYSYIFTDVEQPITWEGCSNFGLRKISFARLAEADKKK